MGALHLPNISHFNPSPYLSPWSLCCVSRYILRLPKMSAQNSAGIQTLLDAEKEAQKIVQKAREYRTKRVKDAKTEAQKEIEEYRKKKEEEFKSEQSSGNKKAEDDANKEAEAKVKEIQEAGKKSGKKVVEDLIKAVTSPHPEVPVKISREN